MKKLAIALLVPCSATFLGMGCLGGDESPEQDQAIEIPDQESDPEYTVTHVELHEDGPPTVTQSTIRLSQQIAERELEEQFERGEIDDDEFGAARSAITKDNSCATTSLRIWSGDNYTAYQICFSGTGHADLTTYCKLWNIFSPPYGCLDYWGGGDVGSFKTGNTPAAITESLSFVDNGCCSTTTMCGLKNIYHSIPSTTCERNKEDVWRGNTAPGCCSTGSSCPGVTPAPCP